MASPYACGGRLSGMDATVPAAAKGTRANTVPAPAVHERPSAPTRSATVRREPGAGGARNTAPLRRRRLDPRVPGAAGRNARAPGDRGAGARAGSRGGVGWPPLALVL